MSADSLESRVAVTESQLRGGAEMFATLRRDIGDLQVATAPKPMSRFQLLAFILGPVIGTIVFMGTFVWQAARYPDRAEFNAARAEAAAAWDRLTESIEQAKIERVQLQADIALLRALVQRMDAERTERPDKPRRP
jgi:hypothetical protein